MKRVLVTGASGLVGKAVARMLENNGWAVRALMHRTPVELGCEVMHANILDPQAIRQAATDCDAIVHCAGLMSNEADELESVNTDGAEVVAQCARELDVAKFLLISSSAVYRPGTLIDATESTALAPHDRYGRSKLKAEDVTRSIFGTNCCVLRPVTVYASYANAFTDLCREAVQHTEIPLVGDGDMPIDLVHVDDLASAVALGLSASGTFNVAGGTPAPLRPLLEAVGHAIGTNPNFVVYDERDRERFPALLVEAATIRRTVSIAAARKDLGYSPLRDWRTALPPALA